MTMMMLGRSGEAAADLDPVNARTVTRTQVDNIPRRFIAGGFGSQRKSANFRRLGKRGNCLKIPKEAG
jgi:hypothetical protein